MIRGADTRWRILLVEDNEPIARTTVESLERRPVSNANEYAHVEHVADFDEALTRIEDRRYDLIILDIRDDEDAAEEEEARGIDDASGDEALPADKGLAVYSEIRKRRFLPIVFYSAVANLAQEQDNPPFVTVVSKLSDEEGALRQKIIEVFDSELPSLNRSFSHHVNNVFHDFMIDFVEKRWSDLSGSEHRGDLAYLMVRRLARSLDSTFIPDMAGVEVASSGAKVHPTRLYVMPALDEWRTGDLVRDDKNNWFIVLTPSCDLIVRGDKAKANYVILACCRPLAETPEYETWQNGGATAISGKLKKIIENSPDGQKDRYYFLPAAWGTPDLVVDLQRLKSVEFDKFRNYAHVATLDDPYAQSIIAQLGRYAGRVGTPDLDTATVKERLERAKGEAAEADGAHAGKRTSRHG